MKLLGAIKGVAEANLRREVDSWIRRVGLFEKLTSAASILSGGQKRKLSVAMALIGNPQFVLLDEPTAGMDPESRRAIWELIMAARTSRSVLLTTHFMDEADVLADRIAIIAKAPLVLAPSLMYGGGGGGGAGTSDEGLARAGSIQSPPPPAAAAAAAVDEGGVSASRAERGGVLRVVDTSLGLKTRWGAGYHLRFGLAETNRAAELLQLVQLHVASATQEELQTREMTILLPTECSGAYAALFRALTPEVMQPLGCLNYGVSLPSLQEVFLKIIDEDEGGYLPPQRAQSSRPPAVLGEELPLPAGGGSDPISTRSRPDLDQISTTLLSTSDAYDPSVTHPAPRFAEMLRLMMSIHWDLWRVDLRGNLFVLGFALVVLLAAFLVPWMFSHWPCTDDEDARGDSLSIAPIFHATAAALPSVHDAVSPLPFLAPLESAARAGLEALARQTRGFTAVSLGAPLSHLPASMAHLEAAVYANSTLFDAVGAFTASRSVSSVGDDLTLWSNGFGLLFDSEYPNSVPVLLGVLDTALLTQVAPGMTISAGYTYLPSGGANSTSWTCGDNQPQLQLRMQLQLSTVLTPIALSISAALFTLSSVLAVVQDRQTKCKHQLLLMGMDIRAYWLSAFLAHGTVLFTALALPAIVAAAATSTISAAAVPAFVLAILLSMPAVLIFSFMMSFLFSKKETAAAYYASMTIMITTVGNLVVSLLPDAASRKLVQYILLIVPLNQLIGAVSTCLQIEMLATGSGTQPIAVDYFALTYTNALTGDTVAGPGSCMLASILSTIVYGFVIYKIDMLLYLRPGTEPPLPPAGRGAAQVVASPVDEDEDEDVAAERARVEAAGEQLHSGPEAAWIAMRSLRKEYRPSLFECSRARRPPKVAVDSLSVAVSPGTCFALLGPNGAGKTSAISMLTGEVFPTAGGAWVKGLSVRTQLTEIFKHTGFCPQFNGLWERLTLDQHLRIYLRLKGVPKSHLAAAAADVEDDYGLREHARKKSKDLSGGTRRKLSAALALACGLPPVVFLDEPTTGVDVGTRRFIWDRIRASVSGRVILLTTHYMDEADALAHRIGIMAGGKLRVIGSPQHLKSRHGGGYRVQTCGPATHADEVCALVRRTFETVELLEAHGGTQCFEVGSNFALGDAFAALEEAKAARLLHSYSISQTSLEQVFLNISAKARGDSASTEHPAELPGASR